jgi:plastocyanin
MTITLRPALTLAALTAGLLACSAHAATVQLNVTGREGQPLVDAVVTLEPVNSPRPAPPAPVQVVIGQQKMQFLPPVSLLPLGSRVRFTNHDSWDHHIRAAPAGLNTPGAPTTYSFELRLEGKVEGKEPASKEVLLDKVGVLQLGCHLHGSMRGHIVVTDSPWVVKTDSNGQAQLSNVPEGAARIRVWHPDQVVDAPAIDVSITPTTQLKLPTAVVPRKRRM